jgi:glucose/arabinose dehydrogenase
MQRIVALLLLLHCATSTAQTLPQHFSRAQVGSTLTNPTVMAFAPDGRISVAEQNGNLRVIKDNILLSTPFISLTVNSLGERGLIGIALDPDFTTNQYIYLYYTTASGGLHNPISRFTANGDVALAGSEQIILELDPLSSATNHNGGALAFGSDEKLYVAIGENANGANSQTLTTYHGKMLRLNKDGSAPPDNPFPNDGDKAKRIWAYGLRNPYTFSIHPTTGRILINDVGQNTTEEVNDATTGGKNFGWPSTEGTTSNPAYTSPIFTYLHAGAQPAGCALTGGTFFSPANTNYPSTYLGKYFIQDFCSNWIYYFDPTSPGPASLFSSAIGGSSVSLTTGPDGNLYYLSRGDSRLYRIIYTPPAQPPLITEQPEPVIVSEGHSTSLSVTATSTLTVTYQWYKDSEIVNDATNSTLTIESATEEDEGVYYVTVTNSAGTTTSEEVAITVTPDKPPIATILHPIEGEIYRAGTSIAFEGTATDEEDGYLEDSQFSWAINFHHDTHKHDQPAITGIKSGSFDVPSRGETSANVWYRFILTVTDSQGLEAKDSVDVHPLTSELTFETIPSGIEVSIDGQLLECPVTITSVVGLERDIKFTGMESETIVTPEEDETYTAMYPPTGLEDEISSSNVYPNPADNRIYFTDRNISSVTIVNSVGKVTTLKPSSHKNGSVADIGHLPAGVYILFYKGDSGDGRKKILISR